MGTFDNMTNFCVFSNIFCNQYRLSWWLTLCILMDFPSNLIESTLEVYCIYLGVSGYIN